MSNSRDLGSDAANGEASLVRRPTLTILGCALLWLAAVWAISHIVLAGTAWAQVVMLAGATVVVVAAVLLSVRSEALLRQASEVRLGESERRYRTLFEDSHAITLIIDPDRLVIVDANQAAFEFYGYTREGLIGRPVSSFTVSEDEDDVAAVAEARAAGVAG